MRPRLEPNLYLVRAEAVDDVARAVEEAMADDGYFREEEPGPSSRTVLLAEVAPGWIAVWDTAANAGPALDSWPDGDPATSLARGLSATTDSDVLYVYGADSLWGYILYRVGLTVDHFASDPRRVAGAFDVDPAEASTHLRGDVTQLRRILEDPATPEEDVVSVLTSGEDALLSFLGLAGIPTGIGLSERSLTELERGHCLALSFSERV